jgi:adenylate cyclase class 1
MTKNGANIQGITSSLRAYSFSPISTDTPDLKSLVNTFIQYIETSSTDQSQDASIISENTLNIYRIASNSKDSHIVQTCLHALLNSERFGRILATRFIHSKTIPLRELAARVAPMAACDRLSLAHEMLLNYPGGNDKKTLSWLEAIMAPLADTDPTELAPFLAELGKREEILAFPVRQLIMNGLFGKWIETQLETGASDQELTDLCHIVMTLDDAKQAQTLAVSVSVGFIKPTAQVIQTITTVAEARSKPVLDMLLKVLKDSGNGLAGTCLDGIIAQDHPATGKLMATIRTKMPALKKAVVTRVPLLDDKGYADYIAALPKKLQAGAQIEAFGVLNSIAPDFIRNITREGTAKGRSIPPMVGNGTTPVVPDSAEGASCKKPGFLARLFKPSPKKLEKLLPKFRHVRNLDLTCSQVENEELDGRELTSLNLSNSIFINTNFIRAKIASSNLAGTSFTNGSATGSTFNANDFTGVDFTDLTFTKCSFNICNFTGAAFTNCEFRECKFRSCTMGGAAFLNVKIRLTGIITSVLTNSSFYGSNVRTSRFEDVDLTGADFIDVDFRGVEFINSVMHTVSIHDSIFTSIDMPGCSMTHSVIHNSDTGHALFLTNKVKQLPTFAQQLEKQIPPYNKEIDPIAAQKILATWSRELTFLRREQRMASNNRRRLARAIKSMEHEKQVYVRILPHLLETDVFERKFNLENVPSCRVWGYHPCLTSLELSRQFFPDHKPGKETPEVRILAVYAMGSLGTVAQTAKSDLDCWVCYDGDLSLDAETGLKRKLDALGLWAESEFGLEAHFFPMRMDDVRENRFSSGDEESSGSAQALLLKEEFYRTALKISGKNIAWWVTPVGANKKNYDECIKASRRYPVAGKPRLEDFGHLAPVPPDEYFGGSLWQMVKAVHSPFKSVLKLGLLETYADPKTTPLSLCDRIKNNIILNRRGVRRTDPYASLFSTLHAYYAKRGDKEAAALHTESFMLKANLCDIPFFMNRAARLEDQSLITTLFGPEYVNPDKVCNSNAIWSFNKSLKMGSSVSNYMVNTYQRIQSGLSANGKSEAFINAKDLTRMGRRIGANFSKKKHKIMRVPFVDTKEGGFAILHFSAKKAPGKKPIWVVRGGSRSEAKKSTEALQLLQQSGDPAHMLAWLLANRIYHPKSLLQADRTVAPISVADLQKVMPAMYDFFPFNKTFERDINEGLNTERVTRVFFIFNLTAPHDAQKIEQASVIYATNWGEMFCRTFLNPGPLLEKHPSRFLAQNLDQPVTDMPEMILFLPKGSQCKRISLI